MVIAADKSTPGLDAMQPRDMEFKSAADKSVQRYVETLPDGFRPDKPCDLVIALHGHGSDRWQYVQQARGECKGTRDVAAKYGAIFVSPDYRGNSWMGPLAEKDLVQIIREQRKTRAVKRVILSGGSMGGASVLIFTALHPELVDGVVSENGTANMLEFPNFLPAIAASYGGTKEQKREEYRKRSPELVPEKFKGIPIAMTAGGKDKSVPPDSVLRLAAALKQQEPGDILLIYRENGGHGTGYDDTVQAMEFVLGRSKVKREKINWQGLQPRKPT